ncbi:unnamed protein product [Pleuronectes platessa]|uniref:Uncharacterized protein n=1 Tax=Pleuronectes platessa TaxID=8262 RepID=A0A9N7UNR6_PLEPL|nr:unnamed protein product [Pleuronectes platessa]
MSTVTPDLTMSSSPGQLPAGGLWQLNHAAWYSRRRTTGVLLGFGGRSEGNKGFLVSWPGPCYMGLTPVVRLPHLKPETKAALPRCVSALDPDTQLERNINHITSSTAALDSAAMLLLCNAARVTDSTETLWKEPLEGTSGRNLWKEPLSRDAHRMNSVGFPGNNIPRINLHFGRFKPDSVTQRKRV